MRPAVRYLLYAIALALLLTVFAWYVQPDFLRAMADQLWACF